VRSYVVWCGQCDNSTALRSARTQALGLLQGEGAGAGEDGGGPEGLLLLPDGEQDGEAAAARTQRRMLLEGGEAEGEGEGEGEAAAAAVAPGAAAGRLLPLIPDGPAAVQVPAPDPAAPGATPEPSLHKPRSCYICKARFSELHFFYDQVLPLQLSS
jgi:hypothetical protein